MAPRSPLSAHEQLGHIVAMGVRLARDELSPVDAADVAAFQQRQVKAGGQFSPEAKPITSRRPFQASERNAVSVNAPPTGS